MNYYNNNNLQLPFECYIQHTVDDQEAWSNNLNPIPYWKYYNSFLKISMIINVLNYVFILFVSKIRMEYS